MATNGVFAYNSYRVRAGVAVTYTGNHAIEIRCSGSVTVDGQVSVSASGSLPGPGAQGAPGAGAAGYSNTCGSTPIFQAPVGGRNQTDPEGIPLQLLGGGSGGSMVRYWIDPWGGIVCLGAGGGPPPGGGGVLAIVASGSIVVGGSISADGASGAGPGAGGSILLRSFTSLIVDGAISANGGRSLYGAGGDGVIRLDAYGGAPAVRGTITPRPVTWELPRLVSLADPVVGGAWTVRQLADGNDVGYVAVAGRSATTPTGYGLLQLDLSTAQTLGTAIMGSSRDAYGDLRISVPAVASLRGLRFHVQSLNWVATHGPRYSNAFSVVVR